MRARTYPIGKLLRLKGQILLDPHVDCFLGQEIRGEAIDELTTAIHARLPKKTPWGVVYESLRHLAGVTLTEEVLEDSVWRLVGNQERLALRKPAFPWCRQEVDEIVPG